MKGMKLSYAAFELTVDRILSNTSTRNAPSVYDLPQRDLPKAYNEGMSPEAFSRSLQHGSVSKAPVQESSDQSSLF
jgi:hypothetical protein